MVSYVEENLVPRVVDRLAAEEPDTLYAEYPRSTLSYEEGYRKITYGDLANAVNGIAAWLLRTLGSGQNFEVLPYIGPNDVRYPALVLGAIKAGYVMFLTSPRNSVGAQIDLFNRLKCKVILSSYPRPPPVTAILASQKLRVLEVPSVQDLIDKKHSQFAYEKPLPETLSEPIFAIHTSGSTGQPKPVIYTHATAAANTKMASMEPPLGFESQDKMYHGKRIFLTFPPFHGAYLVIHLFQAIQFRMVMIAPISGAIPSAEGLVQGLKKTPADIAFIVPSIVQELSLMPDLLEYCSRNLEMIVFAGGDIPQSIGNIVASKVKLVNQFGATEIGLPALLQSKNRAIQDWKYIQLHPDLGIEFRPSIDETHELYVIRDSYKKEQQPTFTIFPEKQEYASHDLFIRHPSKPNFWSWRARADDIIVFLNGEKWNPVSFEQQVVARNSDITAALVVGAQRFQPALLIELSANSIDGNAEGLSIAEKAAFIEKIWPTIEEANKDSPAYARIFKSHILFTETRKPMLRAGKGTIQRPATLQAYATEIEALYTDADTIMLDYSEVIKSPVNPDNISSVFEFTKESILTSTHWPHLHPNDNIFTLGMDSLQALVTVRKLRQGLRMPSIALSTIYTNPSIHELATAVLELSKQGQSSQIIDKQANLMIRSELLKEYQSRIDGIPMLRKKAKFTERHVIILTGSTGALGTYILHVLLANPAVVHVYCLNRATNGSSLQAERSQTHGLSTDLDATRVTFLTADLSRIDLGLHSEAFKNLSSTATLVIHNAWPVNFNLALSSFRPHLDGLVNLISLAANSISSPRLYFISSISSVISYHSASFETLEEVVTVDSASGPNGYAESKYVSEHLLDYAAQKLSIKASFARVGQIAGAVNYKGLWNKAEWFPSLVISSLHVGAIPDFLGPTFERLEWVPIDLLADVLVELAFQDTGIPQSSVSVFHPLNPFPVTWDAIRPVVIDELFRLTGKSLETISMDNWLRKVRKDMEAITGSQNHIKDSELEALILQNPAARLLGFYEEMIWSKGKMSNRLEIIKTLGSSSKLRAVEGIKESWIRKWIGEWIESMP